MIPSKDMQRVLGTMSDLATVLVTSNENLMQYDSCQGNYSSRGKTKPDDGLCALSSNTTAALGNLGAPKSEWISMLLHPQLKHSFLRAAQGKVRSVQVWEFWVISIM